MTNEEAKSCIGTIEMLRRLHGVMNVIDAGNCEKIIKVLSDMKMCEEEQEPKTGHWIMTSDYLTTAYGSMDYVKCSCCGEDSLEEGDFCPNCGARMVEPQESEVNNG